MAKICVFCGKQPESKNKEHIIPQWLIKMTGDPNRSINLGIDVPHMEKNGDIKLRSFSFNAFTFPACKSCNDKGAVLEAKVKSYIEKIFAHDFLNGEEVDELLDWFDKVRIGLWLGSITLDKVDDVVQPNFYINDRIAMRDRCILIYELNDSVNKGINFIGTSSPGFQFIPSCFTLRINNFYFFNMSTEFLLAKNIGFPYPKKLAMVQESDRGRHLEYSQGTQNVTLPLFNYNTKIIKPGIAIYQPIIAKETSDEEYQECFSNPYIQQRLISKHKGSIFYQENQSLKILNEETELRLEGYQKLDPLHARKQIGDQTMTVIYKLLNVKPDDSLLIDESKSNLKKNIQSIINSHKNFMKLSGR